MDKSRIEVFKAEDNRWHVKSSNNQSVSVKAETRSEAMMYATIFAQSSNRTIREVKNNRKNND